MRLFRLLAAIMIVALLAATSSAATIIEDTFSDAGSNPHTPDGWMRILGDGSSTEGGGVFTVSDDTVEPTVFVGMLSETLFNPQPTTTTVQSIVTSLTSAGTSGYGIGFVNPYNLNRFVVQRGPDTLVAHAAWEYETYEANYLIGGAPAFAANETLTVYADSTGYVISVDGFTTGLLSWNTIVDTDNGPTALPDFATLGTQMIPLLMGDNGELGPTTVSYDYYMLSTADGQTGGFDTPIVPEPSTFALLMLGGLGLIAFRKRY